MMHPKGMIEKRVIDKVGVELGVVSRVKEKHIEISEGLFDELLLRRDYIGEEQEKEIILKDTVWKLFEGMEVMDSKGERAGVVKEAIAAGEVLDTLIIETESKEMLFITLEEIYKIGDNISLDIDIDEVRYRQKTHTLRDHIKHYLGHRSSH